MRTRLAVFAAVAAFLVLPASAAGALDGDSPSRTGWWSQDPTASEQPGGGFQVASVAGEAVSVAALAFTVPDDATGGTLTLQETTGTVTPATSLQVCPTAEVWEPASPGAYDDAPAPDCETPVVLTRDETTLVWTADVVVTAGGEQSFMIVPGETAGGGSPLDPGFQVTFSEAALAVRTIPATSAPEPVTSGSFTAPPSFSGGSPSTFAPPGPIAPSAPSTPATPDTVPADVAPAAEEAFQPHEPIGGSGGGADQPWARLLFLVPLSAMVGVAVVLGKRVLLERGMLEEA